MPHGPAFCISLKDFFNNAFNRTVNAAEKPPKMLSPPYFSNAVTPISGLSNLRMKRFVDDHAINPIQTSDKSNSF